MTIGPKNIRIERTPTRYLSDVSGPIRNAVLARPGVDLIIVVSSLRHAVSRSHVECLMS
jgi:hypothetical protein